MKISNKWVERRRANSGETDLTRRNRSPQRGRTRQQRRPAGGAQDEMAGVERSKSVIHQGRWRGGAGGSR